MKIKFNPKKFFTTLGVLAVIGVAVYFIFFFQTTMGFGQEQLDIMNKAKAEYEEKKGSLAADDAIQNINQALFEVRTKYQEVKADGDTETATEFKNLVNPTYQELKKLVEDYLEEEIEDLEQ